MKIRSYQDINMLGFKMRSEYRDIRISRFIRKENISISVSIRIRECGDIRIIIA